MLELGMMVNDEDNDDISYSVSTGNTGLVYVNNLIDYINRPDQLLSCVSNSSELEMISPSNAPASTKNRSSWLSSLKIN